MTESFVLDTNVFLSALLFENSKPTLAYEKARASGRLVASDTTLEAFLSSFPLL
ncbi:PIN domain-containing protein [Subsaximicrobium wynnwilliamsii]|jgi:predicted nucleic acid-binding protein|uniref:hypothetical protein n=1 Tax=Subsaximicrobium wynnwilliamsii TaxID=291179 RepID=UPI001673BDAB|nr:hypothetical protein [Subsaximicrobium wynnwilliamsii]